ncbi:MAG TPA: hypothetical protein VIM74_07285 [Casimicrobiaceae bacterium]|jgi:hypothetical protein
MQRALGYIQHIGPESTVQYETFTCGHCNGIVRMQKDVSLQSLDMAIRQGKEKRDIRRCHGCDRLTCPSCQKNPTCTPFERVLEAVERRARLRAL